MKKLKLNIFSLSCLNNLYTFKVYRFRIKISSNKFLTLNNTPFYIFLLTFKIDLENKVGAITFDNQKVDLDGIEKAIATLGYQANDTKADPAAYETLPKCCKVSS